MFLNLSVFDFFFFLLLLLSPFVSGFAKSSAKSSVAPSGPLKEIVFIGSSEVEGHEIAFEFN